jgi:hypothetical protein
MPKKNPIFSKNRIFDGASMPKKIRFFQKIGFLTERPCKKIRFFQKIGFLTEHLCKKNPIHLKGQILLF